MKKISTWVKVHQIVAFFLLTFMITWGLGFSYGGFMKKGNEFLFPIVSVATCGPALAGIIISTITNTEPKVGKRKEFWITFFVALVLSAFVFLYQIVFSGQTSLSPMLVVFTVVIVLPVAFVIGLTRSRIPTVRKYLTSLTNLRKVWVWVLLGLAIPIFIMLISIPISKIITGKSIPLYQIPEINLGFFGAVISRFLYQLFFFNATGEEVGWRGFALPRLQAKTSPLFAALIITLFWVPWHFFLWQAEGQPVLTWQFWMDSLLKTILFSVMIIWLYNRSKGSILVAGVTHAAGNTASLFIPLEMQGLYLTLLVGILLMILIDRMWKKLPDDHPAVFHHALVESSQT